MRHHDDDHDYVPSGLFNECGIDPPESLDTARHTAIPCQHSVEALRARMRQRISESSLMPFLSLRYPAASDLDSIMDMIVSHTVAECVSIMWEHSGETAAEYRQMLKLARGER